MAAVCQKILSDRHVWPINQPAQSTILACLADKSARLIVHAWHGWPINRPRDYQPLKEKTCLSLLGLVHKSGNWIYWFSTLKSVYTLTLYCGWGRRFNSQPKKCEYQRKKSLPNSKHWKKSMPDEVCKKLTLCPANGIKNCSQRVND